MREVPPPSKAGLLSAKILIRIAGMSGFSMGGVHASMVASLFPGPIACTPLLAPRSAAAAFCNGALWDATAWQPLASLEDEKHRVRLWVLTASRVSSTLEGKSIYKHTPGNLRQHEAAAIACLQAGPLVQRS